MTHHIFCQRRKISSTIANSKWLKKHKVNLAMVQSSKSRHSDQAKQADRLVCLLCFVRTVSVVRPLDPRVRLSLRAPPTADTASKGKAQRSKFAERERGKRISGTARGSREFKSRRPRRNPPKSVEILLARLDNAHFACGETAKLAVVLPRKSLAA